MAVADLGSSREAVRARWADIDTDNSMWNIPAEFMKMKKPHKVPLSKEALRVLDSMKAISGHREWVFPVSKLHSITCMNKQLMRP
jgi:integrase